MSNEQRRNRLLPPNWEIHINSNYVSELEAKAIKFADELERKAAQSRGDAAADESVPVSVHMIVTPPREVITRARQIMSRRGLSITGGDRTHPAPCSTNFTIRRVAIKIRCANNHETNNVESK